MIPAAAMATVRGNVECLRGRLGEAADVTVAVAAVRELLCWRAAVKHLLIVFHSQTGHTRRMAEAVLHGARAEVEQVETRMIGALAAGIEDLLWCDALLIGTPENFGFMSGAVKDFFDRTFYPAQGKVHQLPYAVFVSCGNDGSGAVRQIERIARGYPFRRVADPLIARGELDAAVLARCEELGQTLAAGLALGIF
jgi:flavorubredoxin